MEVDNPDVCARCGSAVDTASSDGLCAACVLDQALEPETDADDQGLVLPDGTHRIGDYELLEEVGRGATGVVFRARQVSLDRIVAVKLLRDGPWADSESIERFRREVRASAALRHPRIVRIYEVAESDGQLYFSMDFVDGPNLGALLEQESVSPRRAAGLVRDLAEAVGHMHACGIVHRDLKPSNVLLDGSVPMITDFGLSTSLEAGGPLTVTGAVLGTPGYLPPEQIGAKLAHQTPQSDERADIYSLGAMLYALLTGRPPFRGATQFETLMEHLRSEVTPPRQLRRSLPRDLETICLKCLERDPERRYRSAADLAEDLNRFLTHRPVRARAIGPIGRGWRWIVRHPGVFGVVGLLALLLLAVSWTRDLLRESRSETRLAQTMSFRELGDVDAALDLIAEEVAETGPSDTSRRIAFDLLSRPRFELHQSIEMQGTACSFDDSGDLVAVSGLTGNSSTIEVYDLKTGDLVDRRASRSRPRELSFAVMMDRGEDKPLTVWNGRLGRLVEIERPPTESPALGWVTGTSYMVSVDRELNMVRWDLTSGRSAMLPSPGFPLAVDGDRLVFRHKDALFEFDLRTNRKTMSFPSGGVLEVSRDGSTAVQSVAPGLLAVWDLPSRRGVTSVPEDAKTHEQVRLSPDGRRLAVGGGGARQGLRVWNLESVEAGPRHLEWRGAPELFLSWARFSSDGRFLAATGLEEGRVSVWIWNVDTGQELARLPGQVFPMWSPAGTRLCTLHAPESNVARGVSTWKFAPLLSSGFNIWEGETLAPAYRVEHPNRDFRLSRQGRRLVAGSSVWDFGSAEEPAQLLLDRQLALAAREVAFLDRDGRPWAVFLPEAVGHGTFPIGLTSLAHGRTELPLEALRMPEPDEADRTLWPFGQQILFSGVDDRIWVAGPIVEYDSVAEASSQRSFALASWTLADGRRAGLAAIDRRDVEANALAQSPDGRTLAVAGRIAQEFGVGLWDTRTGRWTAELAHSLFPADIAFTPDGESIVSVGPESQVEITRLASGESRSWSTGNESLRTLALDSDGQVLATAGKSQDIALWDLATGQLLVRWEAHPAGVRGLAFHPKERWLVSLGDDGWMRIWDLEILREELSRYGLEWNTSFAWDPS